MTKPESLHALRRRAERPARLQRRARMQGDRVAVAVLSGGPRWKPVDTDTDFLVLVYGPVRRLSDLRVAS